MKKRTVLISTCLTLCLLITGCTVRFLYNQMDLLVPWYIKSYIQLNDGQSRFLKKRVNYHLQWHRNTQLPEYIALLDAATETTRLTGQAATDPKTEAPLDYDATYQELSKLRQEIKRLSRDLSNRVAPDLAELFLTATHEQLQDMYERFEKDNKRYKKHYITVDEASLRSRRMDEMQAQIERWIGGMTREQKRLLKTWSKSFIPVSQPMLTYRIRWQERFKDLMAWHREGKENVKADLVTLFANPDQGWNAKHEGMLKHNTEEASRLFANVMQTLTKRQRHRMIKKLEKLSDNFGQLAAEQS